MLRAVEVLILGAASVLLVAASYFRWWPLFATVLWHRRYLGRDDPRVQAIAAGGRCDLYLLTGDEIAFVQDGLRDGEDIRQEMHRWFQSALAAQAAPWLLVSGSPSDRLRTAIGP